jgi:hypothetical protein
MIKGFIYRSGVSIKDFGESIGRIPVIKIFAWPFILLGLFLREKILCAGRAGDFLGR